MPAPAAPTTGPTAPPAAAERPAARRRYLTLLFADLSGSTRLGAELEAEHYAALLESLAAAYRSVVPAHGGLVVRIQGDGVLAIFGHPETLEDDGCRAVDAAIELHAAVRALGPELPVALPRGLDLHTGIHAGLVLLGNGDAVRGLYELMGNVPNIAARLADAAGPDEILVTEETLGPAVDRFVVTRQRELHLAGAPSPLATLSIGGRIEPHLRQASRRGRGLVDFAGRAAELAILEQALNRSRQGQLQRVAIVGPPGLGKSRLAQAFLERCQQQGCDVLQAACTDDALSPPLQPFVQMIKGRLGLDLGAGATASLDHLTTALAGLSNDLLRFTRTLAEALSLLATEAVSPERRAPLVGRMGEAMQALFSQLARNAPVVVFVDDWQWADDASHQLLIAMLGAASVPVLAILASRELTALETGTEPTLQIIELGPLQPQEAALAVRRLLPGVDPFLVDEICRHAGGNPLFIEELCHRAKRSPGQWPAWATREGAAWLNLLIESRVERLPERTLAMVRTAAVLGNTFPEWLFEAVTGCGVNDPERRELERHDLLFAAESPGMLRFKHVTTRDVVYGAIGLHQRKALHQTVADALQARAASPNGSAELCELLAYHLAGAGDAGAAAKYAVMAGDRAVAVSAIDRAQAQYRAALLALDRVPVSREGAQQWVETAQRLGLACVFDPSRSDLPLFERALTLAEQDGDGVALARSRYWLAYIHYALGDQKEALRHSEAAVAAVLVSRDDRLSIQVDAARGQMLVAAGKNREALALLGKAIEVRRGHGNGARLSFTLTYSLSAMGHALADLGRFDEAHAALDEAVALVRHAPREVAASVHGLRAAVLLWQGRWLEAEAAADLAFTIAQQVRSLFTLTMGRAAGRYAAWMARGDPASIAELVEATAWLVPRGNWLFRSFAHGWLADMLAAEGRRPEARQQAAAALQRARRGDSLGAPMACRAMARLALDAGDTQQARRWLARARATGEPRESAHERAVTHWCAAQVELAAGSRSTARRELASAQEAFSRMNMAWHLEKCASLARRL